MQAEIRENRPAPWTMKFKHTFQSARIDDPRKSDLSQNMKKPHIKLATQKKCDRLVLPCD